ncbi:MAG: hypothetical protein R2911_08930 [Caldilineaceae bacterium]
MGVTMTPAGVAESDPVGFLTYRNQLGAQNIKLIAEVDSMHFQWMGGKPTPEVAHCCLRRRRCRGDCSSRGGG